jgi:hypothetical protein
MAMSSSMSLRDGGLLTASVSESHTDEANEDILCIPAFVI